MNGAGIVMRLTGETLLLCMLAGCATGVQQRPDGDGTRVRVLGLQRAALTPRNGGQLIGTESLQPGDILLSSARSLTSAGVRLVTLSPVSHAAVYVGDDRIVEAVGSGVRVRNVGTMLQEESVIVALRHPDLAEDHGERIRAFAMSRIDTRYNHLGIVLQAPFSINRRICELPLLPELVRDYCVRGIAAVHLGPVPNDRFFCSQLVLEAYRQSGLPITSADSRLIDPDDILHMREGDVAPVKIHRALTYVGHLKFSAAVVAEADGS